MTNYNSYNSAPYGAPTDYPGKILGIVAMILSLVNLLFIPTALIGAILGHVAYKQGKDAGFKNIPALVGIIAGWIIVGLTLLVVGFIVLVSAAAVGF
jgi:hypothetical protein